MIKRFSISVPEGLLKMLDKIASRKGYANRSEAIRDLVRDKYVDEEWQNQSKEVVGTVTLVYNHEFRELSDKLTDFQHAHVHNIVSAMHVHLDEHNCLEVLVLRGQANVIREIADRLIATKGVKHGKLVMTTTGQEMV